MSKILIISAVFPPEPVVSARLSWDLAKALSTRYSVTVFCPLPSRPEGFNYSNETISAPFEIFRSESYTCPASNIYGRIRESYSFGKAASKYIKKNRTEISCIYANVWPIFAQKEVVKIAEKLKIPCVLHIHDVYPESLTHKMNSLTGEVINYFMKKIDSKILCKATKIIGISEKMINYLSTTRDVPFYKFELIRNWQDDSIFLNQIESQEKTGSDFVFMYVGSISPSAALSSVIKAYSKTSFNNTILVIAGAGSEKGHIVKMVETLEVKNIEFCEISPDEVPLMQSKADVLILPLKKKIAETATPSKLTSYLLSGKVILACVEGNTDTAEIINAAQCGFIVPPEDIDAIATVMKKMHHMSRVDLQIMGNRGREFALQNLSREVNLLKLTSVIEKLIVR